MSFEQAASRFAQDGSVPTRPARGDAPGFRGFRPRVTPGDILWPLIVIGSLTLLALTIGVHFSVRAFDRESEVREQSLAQGGIAQRIEEVALLAIPQTMWDDAVAHLDNRFDRAWAEANIGRYLAQTAGFDSSFVLLADGRAAYGSIDGVTSPATSYAALAAKAAPLVREVRARELRRGPLHKGATNTMVARPIQASAPDIVDGGLVVLTATLVQPDFGTALPRPAGAPIVVTTMNIDPAFLDQFSRRYQLHGLHVQRVGEAREAGETGIALRGYQGQSVARLAWRPLSPGYEMLRHSLPPIAAAGAALLLIAIALLRRILRLTGGLIEAEGHYRDVAVHDRVSALPNEAYFLDALATAIAHVDAACPVAIHVLELPALQDVRSRHEPAIADEIVQAASFTLQSTCGRESLVARLSDARFGIMTAPMTGDQAEGFAARLRQGLKVALFDGTERAMPARVAHLSVITGGGTALDALRSVEERLFREARQAG